MIHIMNFDEMKVLWDSQKEEPLYAINRDTLHRSIRSEGRSIHRVLNIFEIMSMLILLVMGFAVGLEPTLEGHDVHQFIDAAIYIGTGLYLAAELLRRKKEQQAYPNTLVGDLDRAIFHMKVQIKRYQMFPWIVLGPMTLIMMLKLPFYYDSKPLWLWPMSLLCLLVTCHVLKKDLKDNLIPKRDSLINLKSKLD